MKKRNIYLLLLSAALLLIIAIIVFSTMTVRTTRLSTSSRASSDISPTTQLRDQQLQALTKYQNASETEKAAQYDSLVATAKLRGPALAEKLFMDIQAFPNELLPADVRKNIPADIKSQGLIEYDVELEGVISAMARRDRQDGKPEIRYYILKAGDESYNLFFPQLPNLPPLSTVSVKGIVIGKNIYVESHTIVSAPPQTTSTITSAETKNDPAVFAPSTINYLVILVTFNDPNDPPHNNLPFTKSQVEEVLNTGIKSVKKYYQEVSYGKTTPNFTVVGPYRINQSYTSCWTNDIGLADEAENAARQQGIPVDTFKYRMYVFPPACDTTAIAGFTRYDYDFNFYRMYINGVNIQHVYAHEIGHNLGLEHANKFLCSSNGLPPYGVTPTIPISPVPIDATSKCTVNAPVVVRGDPFDVMGKSADGTSPNHMQAPFKLALGWIPEQRVYSVQNPGDYTVTLQPQEYAVSSGYQIIRVPKPEDPESKPQYYYVEMRKQHGFDSKSTFTDNSIVVHRWNGKISEPYVYVGLDSGLIDASANKFSGTSELRPGDSFNDPINNVSIVYSSYSAAGANVKVTYRPATPPPPLNAYNIYLPQLFKNVDGYGTKFPAPGNPFFSTYSIQNISTTATSCNVYYYTASGKLATWSQLPRPSLPPLASHKNIYISLQNDEPFLPDGVYSGIVSCNQNVAVVSTFADSNGTGGSGAYRGIGTGTEKTAAIWYLSSIYNNYYNYYSNVVVQNPSDKAVAATLYIYEGATEVYKSPSPVPINARGSVIFSQQGLAALGGAAGGNKNYSAKIVATAPVAVVGNIYGSKTDGSIPTGQLFSIAGTRSGSKVAYAPVIMNNFYGYNTALSIQNLGDADAKVKVKYSIAGSATAFTKDITVKKNAKVEQYTPNFTKEGLTAGNVLIGAQVTSDQPVALLVNESDPSNRAASYTGFPAGTKTVFAPMIFNTFNNILNSSITCQNVGTSATIMHIKYSNAQGVSVSERDSTSVGINQAALFYQPNPIERLPKGFNGSAVITATQPIICVVNQNRDIDPWRTTPMDFLTTYEAIGIP